MRSYKLFFFVIVFATIHLHAQQVGSNFETAKKEITTMMLQQAKDWSAGNIEAFMQGYVKSDSLVFIGSRGLTYGWQATLENYKKGYPTKDYMGILTFDLLEFKQLNTGLFFVIGKFNLTRKVGDASGHFSLLLKRMNGSWKIIADHSS